jgi:hypothetical protein
MPRVSKVFARADACVNAEAEEAQFMTAQTLRSQSLKSLTQLARKRGVQGWHAMRKDQLVRALLKGAGRNGAAVPKPITKKSIPMNRARSVKQAVVARQPSHNGSAPSAPTRVKDVDPRILKRLEQAKQRLVRAKILATETDEARIAAAKDRLVVMVRGPYWLHAYWELTPAGIVRAQAALGEQWHNAKPVLRLLHVSQTGASTTADSVLRDIAIHGGVKNWYIDVSDPPQSYRLEIGYLASNGRFFSLARSNTVTTPHSAGADKLDNHWADVVENCDKIYAMSGGYSQETNAGELQEVLEERLRRPVGGTVGDRYGGGAEALVPRDRAVRCRIEAEMVVHGDTHPDALVTFQGAPIKLRPDGSFSVRLDLPNRRQVIPIVASSRDGTSQRTIVLAVERNTKAMEPIQREPSED